MASVLWTISISLLKLGLQGVNLVMANGIRLPIACLVLIPLALGQRQGDFSSKPTAWEIFLGAFSGALSFGLPLSALYLKEKVTARILWGTGLVVAGIFFLL
jgi:drug/metabolite transporter (DMT)-like permease